MDHIIIIGEGFLMGFIEDINIKIIIIGIIIAMIIYVNSFSTIRRGPLVPFLYWCCFKSIVHPNIAINYLLFKNHLQGTCILYSFLFYYIF